MKKFYSFLVAAVLLMGATSCQKEATADAGAADNVEFVASIAGGRTELGKGNKVMWNDSDNIRIFTQENFAGTVFNSNIEEEVTATAKFTTTKSFTASNNGYLAVYPETANTTDNGFSSTVHNASYTEGVWSIPVNLSSGYGNPSNFPMAFEQNAFMVAFSNDNQLSFKAATALLKIKNIENGWGGSVKLFGANLCGEATLHYDTNNAENPISYTLGSGDSHFEYNFPEQNGETIYVPIYPGSVTGFEVYGDDWQNPLVTYNKAITFEAGVIYDLDLDNAPVGGGEEDTRPVSPWQLFDIDMEAPVEMRIDGDYHVATLKQSGSFVITDASMENIFGFAGEVANNQWYKTGVYDEGETHGPAYIMAYENYPLDVYMTEDASWFCVVPQMGGVLPELPVSTLWGMAGTHQASPWDAGKPSTMYTVGDYAVAYNIPGGSQFKFISKVWGGNTGWTGAVGSESASAATTNQINKTAGANVTLPANGSYDVYLHYTSNVFYVTPAGGAAPEAQELLHLQPSSNWKEANAWFAAYFYGAGDKMVYTVDHDGDGIYDFVKLPSYTNIIFIRQNPVAHDLNWDNKWSQTGNLTIPTDGKNMFVTTGWDGAGSWSTK